MALFACVACDTVDESELISPDEQVQGKCTVCLGHPWHNHFEREAYDPEQDVVTNRSLQRSSGE